MSWVAVSFYIALSLGGASPEEGSEGRHGRPAVVVCFRNDDISALSDPRHERRVKALFDHYGIRQTIGVIPLLAADNVLDPFGTACISLSENADIVRMLREWIAAGEVEIALHGLTHRTNRFVTVGHNTEFAEFRKLPRQEQLRRIRAGLAICRSTLGVIPKVFIPPWDQWDRNTVGACLDAGMQVVSADRYVRVFGPLLAVNHNCELERFPQVLEAAKDRSQTVLITVLYHSWAIRTRDDFAMLDRALSAARLNPDVTVRTIGEAARQFRTRVAIANLAGRQVAEQFRDYNHDRGAALLYRRIARRVGLDVEVERLYREADRAYRRGEYQRVVDMSATIDRQCAAVVWYARGLLAVLGALWGALPAAAAIGLRWPTRARTGTSIAFVAIPALTGLSLAWTTAAEITRHEILTDTAVVTVAALLATALPSGFQWIIRLRRKHRPTIGTRSAGLD